MLGPLINNLAERGRSSVVHLYFLPPSSSLSFSQPPLKMKGVQKLMFSIRSGCLLLYVLRVKFIERVGN